jgi:hypothetical protein
MIKLVAETSCATETLPELSELLRDKANGNSRTLLLQALRKSKDPRAKRAIEELSVDPQLVKEISTWPQKKQKS